MNLSIILLKTNKHTTLKTFTKQRFHSKFKVDSKFNQDPIYDSVITCSLTTERTALT